MADTRLVITVAPQYDICPQGSTYPRKAVAMDRRKIDVPEIHTSGCENDLKKSPRDI
jgi:hypothetical protein